MGKSVYGQLSGTDNKGQPFYTAAAYLEANAAVVSLQSVSSSLSGVRAAALTLEAAVSTSLVGSGTAGATAGVGWMSGSKLAALSASYISVTGTIT